MANDFGPASKPCQPSGMFFTSTTCVLASFEKASAAITSTGK